MTKEKGFKELVRARAKRTGESYTTARAILLQKAADKQPVRAKHDQTAALVRLLSPHPPLREAAGEAWMLGMGGGLGFQYFVFEYKGTLPTVYVGTRHGPQYAYSADFMVRAASRAGATPRLMETSSAKVAEKNLREALAKGPTAVWVSKEALMKDAAMAGHTPWVVVAHDLENPDADDGIAIEDVSVGPMNVSMQHLIGAQTALRKGKHRLFQIEPADRQPDVSANIDAAIEDCVADLEGSGAVRGYEKNFGLQALEKWLAAMSAKDRRSFARVFPTGKALSSAVEQIHKWLEVVTGGGAFRPMYATFLEQAGKRHKNKKRQIQLNHAAKQYRALGKRWSTLASGLSKHDPTTEEGASATQRFARETTRAFAASRARGASDTQGLDPGAGPLMTRRARARFSERSAKHSTDPRSSARQTAGRC